MMKRKEKYEQMGEKGGKRWTKEKKGDKKGEKNGKKEKSIWLIIKKNLIFKGGQDIFFPD